MLDDVLGLRMLAAVGIAAAAGWVRGVTGFGSAMVMMPPLSLMIGAKLAVPVVLLLETFAAAPMLPGAVAIASWRLLVPISLAAIACVPIGAYLMSNADPEVLRRAIALIVIVFSLLLLGGVRYTGRQRTSTSLGLGALGGTLLGATGIGGPPVILYLLAGPEPVAVTRANLTLFIVVISAVGVVALAANGVVGGRELVAAVMMAPLYMVGVAIGSRYFAGLGSDQFRRFTVLLMLAVAIGVLLA